VLVRAAVPVSPQDNTGSLGGKLSLVAARLLQEALSGWLRHEIVPQPQREAEATYSARLSREAGEIDWQLPATTIWRRVRAFNPWPGCYTGWRGKQLKIIETMPLAEKGAAGVVETVILPGRGAVPGVGTGDGVLALLRVQLEGKQAMSAPEFLRGQRDFIGAVLSTGKRPEREDSAGA